MKNTLRVVSSIALAAVIGISLMFPVSASAPKPKFSPKPLSAKSNDSSCVTDCIIASFGIEPFLSWCILTQCTFDQQRHKVGVQGPHQTAIAPVPHLSASRLPDHPPEFASFLTAGMASAMVPPAALKPVTPKIDPMCPIGCAIVCLGTEPCTSLCVSFECGFGQMRKKGTEKSITLTARSQ